MHGLRHVRAFPAGLPFSLSPSRLYNRRLAVGGGQPDNEAMACGRLACPDDGFDRAFSLSGVEQVSQDCVVVTGRAGGHRRVGVRAGEG